MDIKNNYFTINNITYVITYNNFKMEIYKKEKDEITPLSDDEKKEIDNILSKKNNFIYDSEKLTEIVNNNPRLTNKEYLMNYLQWLENFIPENYRDNFYRNIETLEINYNLENLSAGTVVSDYGSSGGYNCQTNVIDIDRDSLSYYLGLSQQFENSDEFFWTHYNQLLLHELSHMASSRYNSETECALSGFDTYPSTNISEQNRGLTEGMTEVISMAGVPGTVEIASGYYTEANLVNQLRLILGNDIILESYFGNKGTKLLEQRLSKLGYDRDKAFELFRNIENNYQIRHIDEKQNLLGNIQSSLLDYFDHKCNEEINSQNFDRTNFDNMLRMYEAMLMTPEKLQIMRKNPENYEGLLESIERFNTIRDKYTNAINEGLETSIGDHAIKHLDDVLNHLDNASLEEVQQQLNYYNGSPVFIDGTVYHPINDLVIASRLNQRYHELTGQNHPVFSEQVPVVIDGLLRDKEMLISTGAYTPTYFAQLENINNQLASIKKPMESSTKEELREIKEQLEQVKEQQASQQTNHSSYDEYRESLRNIYLEDKENDTVVHSQFNVTHGENPQCEHTIERINQDGRNIISQRTFDYNDDFRQQVLAPSVIDYAQCSPIMSSEIKEHSSQMVEESQTADYQAVSENNNVLSVNNIESQYAHEISNAVQQIEPIAYQQQQSQQMAMQQEMGGQQLGLSLGSYPSMNGFVNTIILTVVVGIICLLLIFLGIWILA